MPEKRRHIGRLIAAYELGRRDALTGRHKRGREESREFGAYLQGHNDERARMHLHKKLPQYELDLFPEHAHADGPETLPR